MPLRTDPLLPGEYYHIYNRGINSTITFRESRNYFFFLRKIKEILLPNAAEIITYMLMPTHYHLLIQIKDETFSSAMGRLINSYTKAVNREWRRTGPLFEGRFKAKHVDTDEYVLELSRYIHLNPAAANLVAHPDEWCYSSYTTIIGNKDGILPVSDLISSYFINTDPKIGYQQFVEDLLERKYSNISHLLFD